MDKAIYEQRKARILEEICTVFRGVSLGEGIGYYEAHAKDDYLGKSGERQARLKDRQLGSWQELEVNSPDNYQVALGYTDREGFRFLFPAFMVCCIERGWGEFLVEELERLRITNDPRLSVFNASGKRTITHCLQYISAVMDYEVPHWRENNIENSAAEALEKHWAQFL